MTDPLHPPSLRSPESNPPSLRSPESNPPSLRSPVLIPRRCARPDRVESPVASLAWERPLGPAPGHGRLLRVRGATDQAHPARAPGPRRRRRVARRGRRGQLRGARVRGALGHAHAPGTTHGGPAGRRTAPARRRLFGDERGGVRRGPRAGASARAAIGRRGVRGADRTCRRRRRDRVALLRGPACRGTRTHRPGRFARRRQRQADREDRVRTRETERRAGRLARRTAGAARRATGPQAVGDRAGGRGEAAQARRGNGGFVRGAA